MKFTETCSQIYRKRKLHLVKRNWQLKIGLDWKQISLQMKVLGLGEKRQLCLLSDPSISFMLIVKLLLNYIYLRWKMRRIFGPGVYIVINIFIALFCVLGHIDSQKYFYRIFYIFLYFISEYAKNPGGWAR